ncbi:MAG: hypothetical protein MUC93_03240 [Bacteroidales bacterium]|nr:hypothetical protein [Bacteroidales bacterium]
MESSQHNISLIREKFMVWFFAGGETRDDKFNVFTGSFIRLMKLILDNKFEHVRGIYFKTPMMNVAWALNNAQIPINRSRRSRIIDQAFRQLTSNGVDYDTQLIIVSSSSGSVVAAQTAYFLAEMNRERQYFSKPFHLALGASMISKESELFNNLIEHQQNGNIGKIIFDELQDEGDSSTGIGSTTRGRAWSNAFGLMFPFFSSKYNRPSFLNIHPEKGHLHRRRSQTVQKAIDFVEVLLIKHNLAGDYYRDKAKFVINKIYLNQEEKELTQSDTEK